MKSKELKQLQVNARERFENRITRHELFDRDENEITDQIMEFIDHIVTVAYRDGITDTVNCFKFHDEGFGEYCDTGADMDWACRSECTEHGIERARRLYQSTRE